MTIKLYNNIKGVCLDRKGIQELIMLELKILTNHNYFAPGDYTAVQLHQRRLLRSQGDTRIDNV